MQIQPSFHNEINQNQQFLAPFTNKSAREGQKYIYNNCSTSYIQNSKPPDLLSSHFQRNKHNFSINKTDTVHYLQNYSILPLSTSELTPNIPNFINNGIMGLNLGKFPCSTIYKSSRKSTFLLHMKI